jgi:hypothetical protein
MNHPIRPKKPDPILYAELAQLLIDFQDAHPRDWRTRVEHCCDRIGPYVDHLEAEEDQELIAALPGLPVIAGLDDEEIAAYLGLRH